jgi:hypothetical protein
VFLPHVHVVDPVTGSDRLLPTPSLIAPGIVSFQRDGIYLSQGCPEGCPADAGELWRLDPLTGSLTKITQTKGIGWLIGHGAAWTAVTRTDSGSTPSWRVVRLDLASGQAAEWLIVTPPCTSSCRAPDVIGLDAGDHPLVEVWSRDTLEVARLSAPGQAESLLKTTAQSEGVPYFNGGVPDAQAVWFGSRSGIFRYSTSSFEKASNTPGIVAAGCVPR